MPSREVRARAAAKAAALEPVTPEGRIALLERQLARARAACAEAETLLEKKSRTLALANQELAQRRDDLYASLERRTHQLLDAQRVAGFGTMLWDIAQRHLELSPQAERLTGIHPDSDLLGYRALVRCCVRADRPRLLRWIQHDLLGSLDANRCVRCHDVPTPGGGTACVSDDHVIEVRCLTDEPGAEVRWLRVMAQFDFDSGCQAALIFVTVQDITRTVVAAQEAQDLRERERRRMIDLEQLNDELMLAREQAIRASEAKSRFLAMMSHDIRTPLNGLLGMLALLEEAPLSSRQRRNLDLAQTSGEQLRVLLNDIIDLARAEAGKLKLNPATLDLPRLLNDAVSFWRRVAEAKDLALELELGAGMPALVRADPVRLRQLIDNLLSNAIKYTVKGGALLRAQYQSGDILRIEVIDSGIGVPSDRRTELFADFGQLHVLGGEPGGAGLGLAICSRIVDVMGGRIGLRDASGDRIGHQRLVHGSCFWFEVSCPLIAAGGSGAPSPARPNALPPLVLADGGKPHVLVAEDLETNRIVVEGWLKKLGCTVALATNGAEAVEVARSGGFDLVLMDVAMPVMTGPEATRAIRALPGAPGRVPVVALTAYARAEELAPMMQAGACGNVAKPIVLPDLRAEMAKALGLAPPAALPGDTQTAA